MALPLSTACISKSLTRTNPTTPFNSTPFSLTKTLNTKEPTRRALKTSPLHVAAPPHSHHHLYEKKKKQSTELMMRVERRLMILNSLGRIIGTLFLHLRIWTLSCQPHFSFWFVTQFFGLIKLIKNGLLLMINVPIDLPLCQ